MKFGNEDITIKLGSNNVDAIYLGTTLVYSGGSEPPTPPTPTLQWVEFNYGDDISGLDIYGVKGVAIDLAATFVFGDIQFIPSRTNVECSIGEYSCYSDIYGQNDNVELIFSDLGCNDYYNSSATNVEGGTIQLYIYA